MVATALRLWQSAAVSEYAELAVRIRLASKFSIRHRQLINVRWRFRDRLARLSLDAKALRALDPGATSALPRMPTQSRKSILPYLQSTKELLGASLMVRTSGDASRMARD